MTTRDDFDINLIVSVVQNGGFFDRGTLTLFALDCPTEQVIVEWEDGSRSQHKPQDALEKITMDALIGKHPNRVFLTPESLERLRGDADKPELTATEQTLVRVAPDTTLADVHALNANEAARERLKAEQGTLFFKVAATMYRLDPAGVAHDLNDEHEYEGEVADLIPRLPECETAGDCSRVIHEICAKWFKGRVRSLDNYQEIGEAVWNLWQRHRLNSETYVD